WAAGVVVLGSLGGGTVDGWWLCQRNVSPQSRARNCLPVPRVNLARAYCPRHGRLIKHGYLFAVPRASFCTLRFFEPRAYSRLASGFSALRFLRAARLDFLRSSLLSAAVLAISPRVLKIKPAPIARTFLPASSNRSEE